MCTPRMSRRPGGQHRRTRQARHVAPGRPVDPQRDHHDRPGGHLLDPDAAEDGVDGQLDTGQLITHRFPLDDVMQAYDVFSRPAETGALKVALSRA